MPDVSRRAFLRTGAGVAGIGALAGCIIGGRLKRYRIDGDESPDGLQADVSVRATDTPSRERPLVLEFEFTCTAAEATTYRVADPDGFPFGADVATNRAPGRGPGTPPAAGDPARLVVTRRPAVSLVESCWRVGELPADGGSGPAGEGIELAPGETVTERRVLVNEPEGEECYPIGAYRFAEEYWVEREGELVGPIEWGFGLGVSDLDVE